MSAVVSGTVAAQGSDKQISASFVLEDGTTITWTTMLKYPINAFKTKSAKLSYNTTAEIDGTQSFKGYVGLNDLEVEFVLGAKIVGELSEPFCCDHHCICGVGSVLIVKPGPPEGSGGDPLIGEIKSTGDGTYTGHFKAKSGLERFINGSLDMVIDKWACSYATVTYPNNKAVEGLKSLNGFIGAHLFQLNLTDGAVISGILDVDITRQFQVSGAGRWSVE